MERVIQEPVPPLASVNKLLDFATRVIGILMAVSASLFALYLVIEFFQGGSIREMLLIRAAGTIVLALCTAVWLRARGTRQQALASVAGLTFTTTISICTTLTTHYSGDSFEVALAYGLVIAVLNVILWRSIRALLPGLVGALAPPLILMVSQRPDADTLVNYVSLTGVTIILTIAVFVIQQAIVEEIISLHRELVAEAGRDDLTGMLNRRRWTALVSQWEVENPATPYAMLYLDIDDFKALNDRHGHDVRDQVLIAFSDILREIVPAHAFAARFGGDEFVVFHPGIVIEAHNLADTIRMAMQERTEIMYGRSISIGIAEARPGQTRDDLLREADRTMLNVKVGL